MKSIESDIQGCRGCAWYHAWYHDVYDTLNCSFASEGDCGAFNGYAYYNSAEPAQETSEAKCYPASAQSSEKALGEALREALKDLASRPALDEIRDEDPEFDYQREHEAAILFARAALAQAK